METRRQRALDLGERLAAEYAGRLPVGAVMKVIRENADNEFVVTVEPEVETRIRGELDRLAERAAARKAR